MLAADLEPAAVAANIAGDDLSAPMSASALAWIAHRLDSRAGTLDALLCRTGDGSGAPGWLRAVDRADHPRVVRASRYREDMRVFVAHDEAAVLAIGRGVCGRWEFGFEVAPHAQRRGLGREVARAAAELVPPGEALWGQVAPGNAASLRALLAAGYAAVGAEVLFPRSASPAPL
jgi:GNAT superfamily N-acetyltransferase